MSASQNFPGEIKVKGQSINPPAGSNLSGTYETSISCSGDLTLTNDVTVYGNLILNGTLYNAGGYALTVMGDLTALSIDFTPSSTAIVQQDVNIYGDLKTTQNVTVHGPFAGTITADNGSFFTVNIDLQTLGIPNDGSATMTMTSGSDNGQSDTFTYSGAGHNHINPNSGFNNQGSDNGSTFNVTWTETHTNQFPANNGRIPTLWVRGNMTTYSFYGGWNDTGSTGINLYVDGDLINNDEGGDIDLSGGAADASHDGGNGGTLYTGGDLAVNRVLAIGGDSSIAGKYAGNGGTVYSAGDCFSRIITSGGNSAGGAGGGDGGSIDVFGDCTLLTISSEDDNIVSNGGSIDGGAPDYVGNAGAIHIRGNLYGRIRANGGHINDNTYTNASSATIALGNGGSVTIDGNYDMQNNGSGFAAQCSGGGLSGNPSATNSITVNGGNGGTLVVGGNLIARSIGLGCSSGDNTFSTGAGTNLLFNGGNGGSITVRGQVLALTGDAIGVGGASATGSGGGSGGGDPASIGQGGAGGTISLLGGGRATTLYASGGDSNVALPKGAAGSMVLQNGTHVAGTLTMKDGATGTDASASATLTVEGNVVVDTISIEDRADTHISGGTQALLYVGALTDKKTLWNGSVETADVSGITNNTIFKWSGTDSTWHLLREALDVNGNLSRPSSSSAATPDFVISGGGNFDGSDPGGALILRPGDSDYNNGGSGTPGRLVLQGNNGDGTWYDAITIGDNGQAVSVRKNLVVNAGQSILSGGYRMDPSEHNAGGTSGATKFVNWASGSTQTFTTTGNNNIAIEITGGFAIQADGVAGGWYTLKVLTGAGGFSVSVIGDIVWAGGVAPTLTTDAGKLDIFRFYYDGTHYYGSIFGQAFPV